MKRDLKVLMLGGPLDQTYIRIPRDMMRYYTYESLPRRFEFNTKLATPAEPSIKRSCYIRNTQRTMIHETECV